MQVSQVQYVFKFQQYIAKIKMVIGYGTQKMSCKHFTLKT